MTSLQLTRRELLATTAGLTALSGCQGLLPNSSGATDSEPTFGDTESVWPMLGHDQRNTGSVDISFPTGSFTTRRVFNAANEDRTAAPIYASDTVFVSRSDEGDKPAGAYGLTPQTGEERWRAPDAFGYTTPSVFGQTIIYSGDGQTAAVNVDTGEIHWQQPDGASGYYITHIKYDDTLIIRSGKKIIGLDAYTGEQQWASPEIGVIYGFSADDTRIYVARNTDKKSGIVALDLESGDIQWTANGMWGRGRPAVSDGLVFHTDGGTGTLRAVHAADGSDAWQFMSGTETEPETAEAPPAISPDGTRVYFTYVDEGHQTHLVALNTADGEKQWSVGGVGISKQPVVTRNRIFLEGAETIFGVSRSTHTITEHLTLPTSVSSPLALGPQSLLFTVRSEHGECQKYVATPGG